MSPHHTVILIIFLVAIVGCSSLTCSKYSAAVLVQTTQRWVCVDQYELSILQVFPNGTEEPWPFNKPVDGIVAKAYVQPGIKPQAYLSGSQAFVACKLAGKRLCTMDEWLAACQGPNVTTYPYGNTYESGWCNEGRPVNPVNELYGPHATFNYTEMNDPRLDLLSRTVANTGQYSKCVQPAYETYDMHGNLDEWIDHTNPTGTATFKGGFFVDAVINGKGCLYRTVAHAPSYHDYSLGSRCCSDGN